MIYLRTWKCITQPLNEEISTSIFQSCQNEHALFGRKMCNFAKTRFLDNFCGRYFGRNNAVWSIFGLFLLWLPDCFNRFTSGCLSTKLIITELLYFEEKKVNLKLFLDTLLVSRFSRNWSIHTDATKLHRYIYIHTPLLSKIDL